MITAIAAPNATPEELAAIATALLAAPCHPERSAAGAESKDRRSAWTQAMRDPDLDFDDLRALAIARG